MRGLICFFSRWLYSGS